MYSLQVSLQCEQQRQDAILVEIPSTSRTFHQAFEGMEATLRKKWNRTADDQLAVWFCTAILFIFEECCCLPAPDTCSTVVL